jgi:hypothetical protein
VDRRREAKKSRCGREIVAAWKVQRQDGEEVYKRMPLALLATAAQAVAQFEACFPLQRLRLRKEQPLQPWRYSRWRARGTLRA